MITNYTISRINNTLYLVKIEDKIVRECRSFLEAQNFIFLQQSKELIYGRKDKEI